MTYQTHQSEDLSLKVGDCIQCEVRHPYPHTIRMRLIEPAAVAYAKELLENPASGWTATPGVETGEALRPDILERLSYHQLERDDLTLDDCLSYLARGWREVHGRTERQMVMQILELLASRPAGVMGEVPRG